MDATVNDLLNFASERDPQLAQFPLRKLSPTSAERWRRSSPRKRFTSDSRCRRNRCRGRPRDAPPGRAQSGAQCHRRHARRRRIEDLGLSADGCESEVGRHRPRPAATNVLPRIFEPFFTTKHGTGLGLAIV